MMINVIVHIYNTIILLHTTCKKPKILHKTKQKQDTLQIWSLSVTTFMFKQKVGRKKQQPKMCENMAPHQKSAFLTSPSQSYY